MKSLFDLANDIGFDALDREISVWIEMGEFDGSVVTRAEKLSIALDERGQRARTYGENSMQFVHSRIHPNGPYGWEFCSECMVLARSFD